MIWHNSKTIDAGKSYKVNAFFSVMASRREIEEDRKIR
jgi:hypothetical protein